MFNIIMYYNLISEMIVWRRVIHIYLHYSIYNKCSKDSIKKIRMRYEILRPQNVSFILHLTCTFDLRFPGWEAETSISSLREIFRSARMRDSDLSTPQAAMPGLSGWITPERRILASTSARSIRSRRSCMQCSSLCEVIVVPLHISSFTFAPPYNDSR